jgi:hypothetical protein
MTLTPDSGGIFAAGATSSRLRAAASPMALLLDDLPADLLESVAAQLPPDDELAAALTSRRLRRAVAAARLRGGRTGSTTLILSACKTPRRLEWAITCGVPHPTNTPMAHRGDKGALRELQRQGYPLYALTCYGAARDGHLAVLQWARANGCPWGECTCAAARGGHLEVLQWARANGCEWSSMACYAAALGGQHEVLQWARVNGCPWDSDTRNGAMAGTMAAVTCYAAARGVGSMAATIIVIGMCVLCWLVVQVLSSSSAHAAPARAETIARRA